MKVDYELIIVGAGTGGCSAAIRAGMLGIKTLLVDTLSQQKIGDKTCGDCMRGSEIRWSKEVLDVDLNSAVLDQNMGIELLSTNGSIARIMPPKMADKVTVNRHAMGQLLLKKAMSYESVELKSKFRVQGPYVENQCVAGIQWKEGILRSNVVIDASGALGTFREQVQIRPAFPEKMTDKKRMAFAYREILNVKSDSLFHHNVIASYEKEKTGGGYIWYFPMGKNKVNAGLGGDIRKGVKWKQLLHEDMQMRGIVPDGKAMKSSGAFLPARAFSSCPVESGYIGIGDAAFAVSPVDGAGIQSAMIGGVLAVDIVKEAIEKNDFSQKALWPYTAKFLKYSYKGVNDQHGAATSALEILKIVLQSLSEKEYSFLLNSIHESFLEDLYTLTFQNAFRILGTMLRMLTKPKLSFRLSLALFRVWKLRNHYLHYPDSVNEYGRWKKVLDKMLQRGGIL